MNLQEITAVAIKEPTLNKALEYVCIWECERAIAQVLNRKDPETEGWSLCFGLCIETVTRAYNKKQISNEPSSSTKPTKSNYYDRSTTK